MSTTTTDLEALAVQRRLHAATPMLLALASNVAMDTSAIDNPGTLAVAIRNNPVPDDLLVAALDALADLCQELAFAFDIRGEQATR